MEGIQGGIQLEEKGGEERGGLGACSSLLCSTCVPHYLPCLGTVSSYCTLESLLRR